MTREQFAHDIYDLVFNFLSQQGTPPYSEELINLTSLKFVSLAEKYDTDKEIILCVVNSLISSMRINNEYKQDTPYEFVKKYYFCEPYFSILEKLYNLHLPKE